MAKAEKMLTSRRLYDMYKMIIHMYKMIISPRFFCFFFKILIFWVVREVKAALEIVFSIPGHRDQIIPLFVGHFKFQAVSWYMPENSASHHDWKRKKVLPFRSSKTAFAAIFSQYFIQTYSVFFLLNSACWHEQNLTKFNSCVKLPKGRFTRENNSTRKQKK